jgi:MinD-like ATPase involved in chromosome partitioning or flagellar assembly
MTSQPDFDEFDEIEDRAADLMARMQAQRSQRQEAAPDPEEAEVEIEDDDPSGSDEPTIAPLSTPPVPEEPRPAKQMALPPWQSFTPSIEPDLDATDSDEAAGPAPEPADAVVPPPPPWQPGLPGWPPGLPPLPPGWQGPPPWMPPAEPAAHVDPHAHRESRPPKVSANQFSQNTFRMPPSLDEAEIDNADRHAPESGWRRTIYKITGGRVHPGMSRKQHERRELIDQIQQPIAGDFRIAILSLKGGVGKTTTTLGLGSALATVRTDRVIAIDANPDRGTLAERVPDTSTTSTVRDLLRDTNIKRYADVRNHTLMAPSRLEVLASEQDPEVAEVFGEGDYRRTMDILRHYYNIILTDCGTGIMHSAMAGVLDFANAIVLVSSAAIDSARSASATLDWLTQHGHGALVREAHVVLTAPKPGSAALKVDKVVEHFGARCKTTHVIPFERHLAEGAHFDFGLLKPGTTRAYLELAGAVSEKFSRPH